MQDLASAKGSDRGETDGDEQKEGEEQRKARAVGGHDRHVDREQQRRHGGRRGNVLESRIRRSPFVAVRKGNCDHVQQREDEEDRHRQRQAPRIEEVQYPRPLIEQREDDAQPGEQHPALSIRDPGEPDVQEEEIAEETDRPILSGREQRRSREAADETEQRDEDRIAPHREEHGDGGHQRHQQQDGQLRQQMPERVRRKEGREENRDARRVERVGRHRVALRGAQLAGDEKPRADDEADRHADRRAEPAVLDRVAEEEHGRENEGDAGDPGEELDADEALPVDGRQRPARRRRWRGRCRRTNGWRDRSSGVASRGGAAVACARGRARLGDEISAGRHRWRTPEVGEPIGGAQARGATKVARSLWGERANRRWVERRRALRRRVSSSAGAARPLPVRSRRRSSEAVSQLLAQRSRSRASVVVS